MINVLSSSAYSRAGTLRNASVGVGVRGVYATGVCAKSGISAPLTGEVRLLPDTNVLFQTRHVGDFQAPKPMAGAVRVPPWRPPV